MKLTANYWIKYVNTHTSANKTAERLMERYLATNGIEDMDKVAAVGDCAMREIYISWDDAVKLAYERYGEIRELAASGEYLKRKKDPTDYLIAAAADMAEGFKKLGDVPRNIYKHLQQEIEAAKDYMEGQLWQ